MRFSCFSLIVLLGLALVAETTSAQSANSTNADFTFQTQGLPEATQALCRELFKASSAPFAKHQVKLLRSEYTVEGQWNEGDDIIMGSDAFEANTFPFAVKILDEKQVPVDLVVLPEPRWVRRHCKPPKNYRLITARMTERSDLFEFSEERILEKVTRGIQDDSDIRIDCIEFFRLVSYHSRVEDRHALPRGFYPWSWHKFGYYMRPVYPVGLQNKLSRYYIRIHPIEFVEFPETRLHRDIRVNNTNPYGVVRCDEALESNRCVRWVIKNDVAAKEISSWLAYGIVDANGAYSIDSPPDNRSYETGTFHRPLVAPWVPTFKGLNNTVTSEDSIWSYPSLLLTPTVWPNEYLLRSEEDRHYEGNWTLCEQYYSQHEVPVWCLYSDKDSTPFRETFYIKHFDEPCEHNLQKILIFSSAKPIDLVRVLARVHGMEDTAEEIYAEHEDELQAAYDAFRAEINKSLR